MKTKGFATLDAFIQQADASLDSLDVSCAGAGSAIAHPIVFARYHDGSAMKLTKDARGSWQIATESEVS